MCEIYTNLFEHIITLHIGGIRNEIYITKRPLSRQGSIENLNLLKGKKFIISLVGSMKRNGFLQKAEAYLKEAGMEVKLLEGVEPDPSVTTVMNGAKFATRI